MNSPIQSHDSFDGIGLAADGRYLILGYSDSDGPVRIPLRYIFSLEQRPRLVRGRDTSIGGTGHEIPFSEVPVDVLRQARSWLSANAEVARSGGKEGLLRIICQYLDLLEPGNGENYLKRRMDRTVQNQTSFSW
jgi:hypothetical protein